MEFLIEKPSTIEISSNKPFSQVVITCEKGIYYERYFTAPTMRCNVNIPDRGKYRLLNSDGKSIKIGDLIKTPVNFTVPPSKKDYSGKPFFIRVNANLIGGTPARICVTTNPILIEISPTLKDLPIYAQKFIIYHEMGHRFHYNEEHTDLFAVKMMLERGYNQSSCMLALSKVLKKSDANIKRVMNVVGNILS